MSRQSTQGLETNQYQFEDLVNLESRLSTISAPDSIYLQFSDHAGLGVESTSNTSGAIHSINFFQLVSASKLRDSEIRSPDQRLVYRHRFELFDEYFGGFIEARGPLSQLPIPGPHQSHTCTQI